MRSTSATATASVEAKLAWSRTSRHARGYGNAWDKLRKRILERDKYLCQACLPRPVPANHVDHIKPKAKGGDDSESNLRALCKPCHDAKTIADAGHRVKQQIGVDGWPL